MKARLYLKLVAMALYWCIDTTLAQEIIVDPADPDSFATIQQAIDALAQDPTLGDTIVVEPGTYSENLELIEGITLRGQETARTFLEPETATDPTVLVDQISDVTLANFTLIAGEVGIRVENSLNIIIASNVFTLGVTGQGVVIADAASRVTVTHNVFDENEEGIRRPSADTIIQNNIFSNNETSIITGGSEQNISFNCYFANTNASTPGTDFQTGDPLFVDVEAQDFHLQQGSPCIDTGTGTDIIDGTAADIGAYGGQRADPSPFPVPGPTAEDTSTSTDFNIRLRWEPNLAYLVTHDTMPGGYLVYYDSDQSGSPYNGNDANDAGGTSTPSPINVPSPLEVSAGDFIDYELLDLNPTSTVPTAPQLLSLEPTAQSLTASWSAVQEATGYRVYYGVAAVDENQIDVGNVTSFQITGLQSGTTYQVAVSALVQDTYYLAVRVYDSTAQDPLDANVSVFSPETSLELGPLGESALSNVLTGTPEAVVPFPDLPDEGCFLATAAYGSYSASQVQLLRVFRDRYLLTHAPGRAFVSWYYEVSPAAAAFIAEHTALRNIVQILLLPAVGIAYLTTQVSPIVPAVIIAVLALFLTAAISRYRARRRSRRTITEVE